MFESWIAHGKTQSETRNRNGIGPIPGGNLACGKMLLPRIALRLRSLEPWNLPIAQTALANIDFRYPKTIGCTPHLRGRCIPEAKRRFKWRDARHGMSLPRRDCGAMARSAPSAWAVASHGWHAVFTGPDTTYCRLVKMRSDPHPASRFILQATVFPGGNCLHHERKAYSALPRFVRSGAKKGGR